MRITSAGSHIGFQDQIRPALRASLLYIEASFGRTVWNCVLRGGMGVISGTEIELGYLFRRASSPRISRSSGKAPALNPSPQCMLQPGRATVHSYGLLIERDGHRTFLTTDTQFTWSPGRFASERRPHFSRLRNRSGRDRCPSPLRPGSASGRRARH